MYILAGILGVGALAYLLSRKTADAERVPDGTLSGLGATSVSHGFALKVRSQCPAQLPKARYSDIKSVYSAAMAAMPSVGCSVHDRFYIVKLSSSRALSKTGGNLVEEIVASWKFNRGARRWELRYNGIGFSVQTQVARA